MRLLQYTYMEGEGKGKSGHVRHLIVERYCIFSESDVAYVSRLPPPTPPGLPLPYLQTANNPLLEIAW